jgi:ESF2/ABP1 family protein
MGVVNRMMFMIDAKNGKKGGQQQQQQKNTGMFIDGWVEFKSKRSAKNAALALNGTPIGGSKRSKVYGEMWALKYLSKFKWSHLTEQIAYERAVREQKLRAEISQAKREAGLYLKQVERAQTNEKIAAKRAAKNPDGAQEASSGDQDMEAIRVRFRQRKPIQQKSEE